MTSHGPIALLVDTSPNNARTFMYLFDWRPECRRHATRTGRRRDALLELPFVFDTLRFDWVPHAATRGARTRSPLRKAPRSSGRHCATNSLEAAGDPVDDETAVLIGRLLPREVAGIQLVDLAVGQ